MNKLRFVKYDRPGFIIGLGYSWVFDCFRIIIKVGKWGFTYRERYANGKNKSNSISH